MTKPVQYNWSLISKYRNILMGIGILGVMFAHLLEWGSVKGIVALILRPFNGLVFTEGFLFLSGFGLYYSFSRNDDSRSLYKKRIDRLLIPFIIISLPFYLERMIFYGRSFWEFLLNITTLRFWFLGNDGMWYISVSLLLYVLFPLMYKFMFSGGSVWEQKRVSLRTTLLLILLVGIVLLLFYACPGYYQLTGIGISKIPIFAIGIYFGYLSQKELHFNSDVMFIILLGILIIALNFFGGIAAEFENSVHRLFCIIILCILFALLEKYQHGVFAFLKTVFEWFGRYTLEMYILHMFIFNIVSQYMKDVWGGGIFNRHHHPHCTLCTYNC